MNLEQLGAWGDFIGGIAVVAGLAFVGIQLLGANREARAATLQSALEMQMRVDSELSRSSDTWNKVVSNLPIEEHAERRKAILLFNLVMTNIENRYHQFQAGYLDSISWEASKGAMKRTLSCDISAEWRLSIGAATHTADFLALIDEVLNGEKNDT